MSIITGGWTPPRPADEETKIIARWMWNISEATTGKKYEMFDAVEVRTQVVNGVNYLIKVHVGGNDYVHLWLLQSPLVEETISFTFLKAKGGYKKDDPLDPDDSKQ